MSNPIKVLFYRVSGLSKDDTRTYCRNQIDKQFNNSIESNFYFEEFEGLTYCEIQEGGTSECYLTDTIKQLTENGADEVYIPSGTRYVKADYEATTGIKFLLMNEGFTPPEDALIAKKTNLMKPYHSDNRVFYQVSLFAFIISFVSAIAISVIMVGASKVNIVQPEIKEDQFSSLHTVMRQVESLPEDRYVDKIIFDNNDWKLDLKRKEVKVLEDELSEDELNEKIMKVFTAPEIDIDNKKGEENE